MTLANGQRGHHSCHPISVHAKRAHFSARVHTTLPARTRTFPTPSVSSAAAPRAFDAPPHTFGAPPRAFGAPPPPTSQPHTDSASVTALLSTMIQQQGQQQSTMGGILVDLAATVKNMVDSNRNPNRVASSSPDEEHRRLAARAIARVKEERARRTLPDQQVTRANMMEMLLEQTTATAKGGSIAYPLVATFERSRRDGKEMNQAQLRQVYGHNIAVSAACAALIRDLEGGATNSQANSSANYLMSVVLDAFEPLLHHAIHGNSHYGFANPAAEICTWMRNDGSIFSQIWDPMDMNDAEVRVAIDLCFTIDKKITATKTRILKQTKIASSGVSKLERTLRRGTKGKKKRPRAPTRKPQSATKWCVQCANNFRREQVCMSHNVEGCAADKKARDDKRASAAAR
jgi:hypothetical protein